MLAQDERPIGARVTMDMVGSKTSELAVAWTEKDVMLYALGVGASQDDAFADLDLTTENSEGVSLKVLPTFITTIALGRRPEALNHLDIARFLHAEQRVEILHPFPASGRGISSSEVTSVIDKGVGAFFTTVSTIRDEVDGTPLSRASNTIFVRGAGGFGGPRGSSEKQPFPDRAPDTSITYRTRPDQALLYRLSGDRNPLHSDPTHAHERGFKQPILHGLCTYGFACRALVQGVAGGDPDRLVMVDTRLSKPVYPGEALTTDIWTDGAGNVQFRVRDSAGEVVLDRGTARVSG